MKITLLGTGTSQGIPQIACDCKVCMSENPKDNRLRSSIMIEVDNQTLVVDTGPDFRTQMLREKVKKVDAKSACINYAISIKEFDKNFVESLLEGVKAKIKSIDDNGVYFSFKYFKTAAS